MRTSSIIFTILPLLAAHRVVAASNAWAIYLECSQKCWEEGVKKYPNCDPDGAGASLNVPCKCQNDNFIKAVRPCIEENCSVFETNTIRSRLIGGCRTYNGVTFPKAWGENVLGGYTMTQKPTPGVKPTIAPMSDEDSSSKSGSSSGSGESSGSAAVGRAEVGIAAVAGAVVAALL